MTPFETLCAANLGSIDALLEQAAGEKAAYVQPSRRNLGTVAIVLLREAVAPVVFRNEENALTRIEVPGVPGDRLRATPNKTKFQERGIGLQILRALGLGGKYAQNRTVIDGSPGKSFDLNTCVFGDSAMQGKRVLPAKAGVCYSDSLSLQPAARSEIVSMHVSSGEEGTLFDAQTKKGSVNLFDRHVVRPGTFFLQVLTLRGKTMTREGLDHLLLSLGVAGAYGGQTSVTGTNLRTHIAGVFGGAFEQPENSPYVLLERIQASVDLANPTKDGVIAAIQKIGSRVYPQSVSHEEAEAVRTDLVNRFVANDAALLASYRGAAQAYSAYFDAYYGSGKVEAPKKPKKSKPEAGNAAPEAA